MEREAARGAVVDVHSPIKCPEVPGKSVCAAISLFEF